MEKRQASASASQCRAPDLGADESDERWSMDFASDALGDGRKFRSLTLVGDCTRRDDATRDPVRCLATQQQRLGGVRNVSIARLELTVQRGPKTLPRRSMIVPRRETIVQHEETIVHHEETIVQRVETTVPRHQVYRLLRAVDRDAWLGEAIGR